MKETALTSKQIREFILDWVTKVQDSDSGHPNSMSYRDNVWVKFL